MPNIFDFEGDTLARADPLDRPVSVVDGTLVDPPAPPVQRPAAAPPTPAATLRAALPGFADLIGILADGAPPPDVGLVDELVALGSALVAAPDAAGTDHLLLAVALHLRGVVDGGGWGDADDGADDAGATTFGEIPGMGLDEAEHDKAMHSMLVVGPDMTLMAADVPAVTEVGPNGTMTLSGEDEAQLRPYWDALSAGGTVGVPLREGAVGRLLRHVHRQVRAWMVDIAGSGS